MLRRLFYSKYVYKVLLLFLLLLLQKAEDSSNSPREMLFLRR